MDKGNLHQLLAVKKEVATRANEITGETKKVFDKKHLFYGSLKSYIPFEEGGELTNEPNESEHLSYTVGEKLDWFSNELGKLVDIEYQIDVTNQVAIGNIDVDELTLPPLPASFLLDLIGLLERTRAIYGHAPTLDPKYEWKLEPELGEGVYKAIPDAVTYRTRKALNHKILYDATTEHPAQIEKWTEDVRIGKFVTKHWSGALTAHQKATLLGRLDTLIQATKKALSAANAEKHTKEKVADEIFAWLHWDMPLGGVARSGEQPQLDADD